MTDTKTYNDYLERLDALREKMLGIKRNPTEEEQKIQAEYAIAFRDMLHTGIPQNTIKIGSDGSGGFLVPDTLEEKSVGYGAGRASQTKRILKAHHVAESVFR